MNKKKILTSENEWNEIRKQKRAFVHEKKNKIKTIFNINNQKTEKPIQSVKEDERKKEARSG